MLSLRTGIIGGLMVAVALFWLVPAVLGLFFSVILFAIALPFRLLRLIFITGLGGLLALLWRLFSGFLGLFGIFGALVKWLLVIVAGTFGLMFLWGFVGSWRDSRVKSTNAPGRWKSWDWTTPLPSRKLNSATANSSKRNTPTGSPPTPRLLSDAPPRNASNGSTGPT